MTKNAEDMMGRFLSQGRQRNRKERILFRAKRKGAK